MKKSFDDILNECIRRIESGEDIESVLQSYAEHADELRPHLEILTSLSVVEQREATPQGALRGRQQLLSAIVSGGRKREETGVVNSLATKGGLSMKFVAMFVGGAVLALGITFLTGNLDFGGGSGSGPAQAEHLPACLAALDFTGDDEFTVEDVLAFKDAIDSDDPAFDFNGDTVTDIFDVLDVVGAVVLCFQENQPPAPTPPPIPPLP